MERVVIKRIERIAGMIDKRFEKRRQEVCERGRDSKKGGKLGMIFEGVNVSNYRSN